MISLERRLHAIFAILLAASVGGCGQPVDETTEPTAAVALVDHAAWSVATSDPLAAHRPADAGCESGSHYVEDDALEVQTGYCNYLILEQASLAAVRTGDQLELLMVHADLDAPEAAELHIALLWDDAIAWEHTSTIPGPAQAFDRDWLAPADRPLGSKLVLHLHNHGFNSYKFVSFDVRPAP